jgi:patatin-like phospholipase/acyl hydrolase
LDGGGVRGAFTAAYLAELEQIHGKPIFRSFDLIAGTSTGAFIALALALGKPASSIVDFYREWGDRKSVV